MILPKLFFVLLISYLLGSLSFAIIVSKGIYKKDIRQFGSGNAGMTNILRTFGKKAAALTIIGDVLKGFVSVMIARLLFHIPKYAPQAISDILIGGLSFQVSGEFLLELSMYLAVFGSLLGHLYPVFFGFKGGKGMSVISGSMMATTPITLSIALGIFLAIAFGAKIVSLASIVASVSYFFITLIYFKLTNTFSILNMISATVLPLIILYAHRANIKRLINGTEYKFGKKK
ncbi:MAG: glycerol-3-phosphate 1-O-acyltransferase PlsY [Oscillospiraceae bacterium]